MLKILDPKQAWTLYRMGKCICVKVDGTLYKINGRTSASVFNGKSDLYWVA